MRVLLQFPEGLKKEALRHARKYEKEGHDVFISASACYGACDLALDEARTVNAKKIIHFGHAPFIKKELPVDVEYVEHHINVNLDGIEKAVEGINEKKIALGTTVQHTHQIDRIKKIFESAGKEVFTGKGRLAHYKGQVLGCDYTAVTGFKDAEAVVIVGDGLFHAIGIQTDKPVYVIHPQSGVLTNIGKDIERMIKRRKGSIAKALECRKFAVLLSTKPGQFHPQVAEKMKKELEEKNREAAIVVGSEFSPLTLSNFTEFECYVNTACPRIADDVEAFGKPILNPGMVKEMLGMLD
jgi:2-(3-amino-3-carboxypropyl)histidine synthase